MEQHVINIMITRLYVDTVQFSPLELQKSLNKCYVLGYFSDEGRKTALAAAHIQQDRSTTMLSVAFVLESSLIQTLSKYYSLG